MISLSWESVKEWLFFLNAIRLRGSSVFYYRKKCLLPVLKLCIKSFLDCLRDWVVMLNIQIMKCRKKRIKYLITDLNMTADARFMLQLVKIFFFWYWHIYMYVLHTRITEKYKGLRGTGDKLVSFIVGHLWVRAPSKDPIVSSSKKLYPHCLVLDGSRTDSSGFTLAIVACFTIELK